MKQPIFRINLQRRCQHVWHVRPATITENGADFICHKCLSTNYHIFKTAREFQAAQIYLFARKLLTQ